MDYIENFVESNLSLKVIFSVRKNFRKKSRQFQFLKSALIDIKDRLKRCCAIFLSNKLKRPRAKLQLGFRAIFKYFPRRLFPLAVLAKRRQVRSIEWSKEPGNLRGE